MDVNEFEKWVEENTDDPKEKSPPQDTEDSAEETYIKEEKKSRLEKLRGDSTNRAKISRTRETEIIMKMLIAVIGFFILMTIIVQCFFSPVVVVGSSMYPTLHDGDKLRTSKRFDQSEIKRNSIICYKKEGKFLIKRVIGMPGEKISFKDGYIYINDVKQEEEYPLMKEYPEEVIILADDEFYCLGDNRNNSIDSRVYGPTKYKEITNLVLSNMSENERNKAERQRLKEQFMAEYYKALASATDASSTDAENTNTKED